jgi:endogenous inhibitor of DNA gyrase (YacG/DUF329 family)
MLEKLLTADCSECESRYEIAFIEVEASTEIPEFCPFCGSKIDDITLQSEEDDELDIDGGQEWD